MRTYFKVTAAAMAAALAVTGYAAYQFGLHRGAAAAALTPPAARSEAAASAPEMSVAAGEAATRRHIEQGLKAGLIDPTNGRRILYYHDPMMPGQRFDEPAKSPFMDMMLVPVYSEAHADAAADAPDAVRISPRMQQNFGVRTMVAVMGTLHPQVAAVGSIAWNEREQSVVQARAAGYIERLHVRATLDPVRQGQPVADLYVPEWVAAQEEFLAVRRLAGSEPALVDAARQRMRLVGMSDAQIDRVEASGAVQPRVTLTAPSSGVVAELIARVGMSVAPGTTLARINGLSTVWAVAELPESQAAQVHAGMPVQARSPGVPGVVFRGTVQALLPEVNATTRTLKARVELANPGGRLVPGLFVTMQFTGMQATTTVLVPTEAVIQTGHRAVVLRAEGDGRFVPVDVEIGLESAGQTEIKRGLAAGQRVAVSSQFLIDSEASLKGATARMNGEAPTEMAASASGAAR